MNLSRHAVMFLATGGYVGLIPIGPGTFGSLVGIPLAYACSKLSLPTAACVILLMVSAGVIVAHAAEKELKKKDPGCVVIDEIIGMCIALFAIPFTISNCIIGFVLFRIFDIVKPPPARQLDRRLKGGWGIVLDDVAAGAMANIVLHLARTLTG